MKVKGYITGLIGSKNFKHGILYTVFSFFNNGIGFILLLILARYLTPEDYGYLNLFSTFISICGIVISLSTVSYIGICFFQRDGETLRKVILIALGTTTIMLTFLTGILILFPTFAEKYIGVPVRYLWLGLLICYFQVFNTLNLDIWRLEEKPIRYGIYGVSLAICNMILTLYMVIGLHMGWIGRVYAWLYLGTIYFAISLIFLIKRKYLIFKRPNLTLFKETYIYALPLIPHSLSFWLKQGLDRYILNFFYDQSVVGYFSFAMNLASVIMIIGTAFNSTNSVFMYKKLAEGYAKVRHVLSKMTGIMIWIFLFASVAVALFAVGLIRLCLYQYEGSIQYILPLCIGSYAQCIYLLSVNYLFFYKRTRQLMYITFSTAILQMLLSIWLTRFSPLYTAYISMSVNILTTYIVCYKSRILLRKQLVQS